ncbi:MAG: ABC transporter substrate-binding protein [Kineosporiaceae bacterium]|nr:ABC transporter substrate-binding protein [Kineosporiaceae bacterium]
MTTISAGSRRVRRVLVLMAALPLLLTACVSADPEPGSSAASGSGAASSGAAAATLAPSDAAAPVTLTWWTGQEAEAQKILDGLAADFTKAHPNVTIQTSPGASTTDALLPKMLSAFAADTQPDISYAFGSWASQLGRSGKTLDITADVAQPAAKWDEFPESARKTASPEGHTIGFPAVVDNLGLFYNKTVFDAAGVAYPTADWSWDDFRAAAKKLTNPAKNVYGTAMAVNPGEDITWHMWPQLWQNGGQILSADEKKSAFNSEAGVKTVSFWRDLAQVDKSVYLDQTGEKYAPLFASNNIGMMISGPWHLYDVVTGKTKYGVVRLPGTNGDHQTVSGPDLWVLFDHQDANRAYWSYQFLLWLTAAEQDERWSMAIGNLPLRSAAKTTPAFAKAVAEYPGYEVFAENLANATNKRPTVPGYIGLSDAFGTAVSRLLQGQGEVKAELDKAAAAADTALADS